VDEIAANNGGNPLLLPSCSCAGRTSNWRWDVRWTRRPTRPGPSRSRGRGTWQRVTGQAAAPAGNRRS